MYLLKINEEKPAEGIPCLRVINNDGPVTALCIDIINGCLITGSQDKIIRIFDIDKKDEIGISIFFLPYA